MDRIIGKKRKYCHSAVLLPLVDLDGGRRILFEVRNSAIPQGSEICLPGGKIDRKTDPSPEAACIRETSEELGIRKDRIRVTGYIGTAISVTGAAVDAFAGEIDIGSLDDLRPNRSEVERVFCIPLSWFATHKPQEYKVRLEIHPSDAEGNDADDHLLPAKKLGLPEKYHKPWPGRKMPVYAYMTEHGVIWGLTAEIVMEFLESGADDRSV